ncbi:Tetratricopeptide repeat family protein [Giardia duodenalis]|uniref:Tetratricopeptide repeat family protein n=1 Tax=Giardia intestinalis TaxID=5741 RepID=V6TXW8_GIAIN|nr:Tetratricopeptide repeat family protein [Giardia intestinalis]
MFGIRVILEEKLCSYAIKLVSMKKLTEVGSVD